MVTDTISALRAGRLITSPVSWAIADAVHFLGKGEVLSSILSGSTSQTLELCGYLHGLIGRTQSYALSSARASETISQATLICFRRSSRTRRSSSPSA